jgi:hypothetical protein
MKHRRKLEDDQLVNALLAARTIAAAARRCGVSRRTVERRLADVGFQTKFTEARSKLVSNARDRLTANAGGAAEILKTIYQDKRAAHGARVSAASQTIRLCLETYEIFELEERIRRLEEHRHEAI